MYSQGSSEEILGRALRDFADRDDIVIATKVRHPMRSGPQRQGPVPQGDHDRDRPQPAPARHRLRRPLPDPPLDNTTPIEETLEALHDVVKAGKARYLGASSMHAWEFAKALHLQREHGWARFVSMQDHYNLLAREEEREMLPLCLDEGVGTVVWSPLARGRLARPWDEAKRTERSATTRSPTCSTRQRPSAAIGRSSTRSGRSPPSVA